MTIDAEREQDSIGGVAPLSEKFDGIRRIAVLRGGGIGDLLFALPAIDSLQLAYPHAQITVLGSPVHAQLLAGRRVPHDVVVLPAFPGVRDGAGAQDPAASEEFFQRMRRRDFDLAVQLHGGGRHSNPFLNRLGAAHTVGMRTPDAALVERWMPYSYYQHEVLRALEVVGLAGAAPVALEPRLDAGAADRDRALRFVDQQAQALLVIHPGASDLRRRWPAERFAEVAARVVAADAQVILVGDDSDRPVAEDIVRRVRLAVPAGQAARVSSVAGQLTLPQLIGLFAVASAMLGNDSGPRHLAQAVGTPTIGVYWVGNLINAGPLGRGQHRVQLSWTTACPVCDRDCTQVGWTSERCEHEVSFVTDVRVDAVFEDVAEQLALRVARSETA